VVAAGSSALHRRQAQQASLSSEFRQETRAILLCRAPAIPPRHCRHACTHQHMQCLSHLPLHLYKLPHQCLLRQHTFPFPSVTARLLFPPHPCHHQIRPCPQISLTYRLSLPQRSRELLTLPGRQQQVLWQPLQGRHPHASASIGTLVPLVPRHGTM
jgi:hypothetical protein